MNEATVSVVIPAYNAAATIGRAIDSVLAQSRLPHEVIVVDDGSTDETAEIVNRYGERIKLVPQANAKTSAARNRGIDSASGDFIAFLDADDFWEPQKLERQIAVFDQYPEVGVVASHFYVAEPGQSRRVNAMRMSHWFDSPQRRSGAEAFLLGTMLWTGTVVTRRSSLGDERFVTGLEPAEDRDLWIRLTSKSVVYLQSDPLATAVLVPGSLSRSCIATDCTAMLKVIGRNRTLLGSVPSCQWKSYVWYRWAANEPSAVSSLPMLLRSLVTWPLPLTGIPSMKPLARVKRFVLLFRQSLTQFRRGREVPSC